MRDDTVLEPPPLLATEGHEPRSAGVALSRAVLRPTVAASLAASALAACGGGGAGANDPTPVAGRSVTLPSSGYSGSTSASNDIEASRFLLQAQFSASDADLVAVRSQGYVRWLQSQIGASYITGWDWLNSQGFADPYNSNNYYDQSYPCDFMVWSQLMASAAPVRARMALALSELFVVSLNSLEVEWRSHVMAHYWDTLMRHGLGNFRELLEAITLNVAMGCFLNTKGNKKENNAGRQPDENYAREVMQLFTIGLHRLNPDGSVQMDGSGKPLETYTSSDVSNLARVFTGYDLDQSQNQPTSINGRTIRSTHFARLPMRFTASNHSMLEASFLGVTIPANTSGSEALKTALDTLFNHANTAPFICKQLIQRLVTSNPSPAYVQRVAAVFVDNGQGVRGDLAFVLAAILLDDEARSSAGLNAPEFGKLREPMVRMVQWARTFDVRSASGAWRIWDHSDAGDSLGQNPLRAASVFNFFRPGYVPPNTTLSSGKVAPEFQIVNETSVGGYLNYMMSVISSGVSYSSDMRAAYTRELPLSILPTVANPSALVDRLNLLLCAGQLSTNTVTTITTMIGSMASTSDAHKRNRVCAAVLMVMACVEYLVQK